MAGTGISTGFEPGNHNKTTGDRATAAVAAQALPLGQAWYKTFTAMALVWFARGFVESLKEGRNPHIAKSSLVLRRGRYTQ
ncbi:hypothetical protein PPUN15366_33660 [Pseudomonas putida]|nr:hypothetical protein PPUN15366_33660 [Pseudomonas putida]